MRLANHSAVFAHDHQNTEEFRQFPQTKCEVQWLTPPIPPVFPQAGWWVPGPITRNLQVKPYTLNVKP